MTDERIPAEGGTLDPKPEHVEPPEHVEMKAASTQLDSSDHLGVAAKMKAVAEKAADLHEAYHDSVKHDAPAHVIDAIEHAVHSIVTNVHANLTRLAADLPPFHKHEKHEEEKHDEPVKYTPAEDVEHHDPAGPVAEQASPSSSDSQARPPVA